VAQSLATRRSNAIGMVVSVLDSPYFGMMMAAVEEIIQVHGMHLIVISDHQERQRERTAIEFLLQRRCDGLVVHADALDDRELVALCRGSTAPMVIINRWVEALAAYCIHSDDGLGARKAVAHLVARGHRRIGCITGPLALHESRQRLAGYRGAMATAGCEVSSDWVVEADFQITGGARAIEALLDRCPEITAVFVHNDQMAAGVLDACRDRGMEIPRQLSVVGFDDVEWARYLHPRLTTVRQPVHAMGVATGRLLLQRLGREPAGEQLTTRFVPELIERESVAISR
jgi:LacI family transcriptional regulator